MSWSKYYKDSTSFKRDNIVKSVPKETAGWQSKSKKPDTPFEPGKISTQSQQKKPPAPEQPATTDAIPATDSQTTAGSATPTTPEEAPAVDLSQYILVSEANENAEARYRQGIQDGIAKTAEDYGSAINALTSCCAQLDSVRETIINNSSHELLEFALLISEKIVRISIKEQDQTIVATIEEALARAVKSDEFTVFINPDDYESVANKSQDFIAGVSGLNNIVIKIDPTLEKGGAKIESENCIIDATISSQFDAIREELLQKKQ